MMGGLAKAVGMGVGVKGLCRRTVGLWMGVPARQGASEGCGLRPNGLVLSILAELDEVGQLEVGQPVGGQPAQQVRWSGDAKPLGSGRSDPFRCLPAMDYSVTQGTGWYLSWVQTHPCTENPRTPQARQKS